MRHKRQKSSNMDVFLQFCVLSVGISAIHELCESSIMADQSEKEETMETNDDSKSSSWIKNKPPVPENPAEHIKYSGELMSRTETEFEDTFTHVELPDQKDKVYRDVNDDIIKLDTRIEMSCKTLVVVPVKASALTPNVLVILSQKSRNFSMKYYDMTNKADPTGYLVLKVTNYEDVKFFTENKIWSDDNVTVKQVKFQQRVFDVVQEALKEDTPKNTDTNQYEYSKQSLIVDNLPENIQESELSYLLPDATRVVIARDTDYKNKGYAYAVYGSVADTVAAEKKYEDGLKYGDVYLMCMRVDTYRKKWREWKNKLDRIPGGWELKPVAGEKPIIEAKLLKEMQWCSKYLKDAIEEAGKKKKVPTATLR